MSEVRTIDRAAPATRRRLARRRRGERALKAAGLGALGLAGLMLAVLVGSLVASGYPAFTQTRLALEVDLDPALIPAGDPAAGDYRRILGDALAAGFPEGADRRELAGIVTPSAHYLLRDIVVAQPSLIGTSYRFEVPLADPYDQLAKGLLDRAMPEVNRRLDDREIARFDRLDAAGLVSAPFNWGLIANGDSIRPEMAGLAGALMGSLYALLVCFLVSFPVGIAAGVYLEEFAPRNRFSGLIEVNINNLAAVPSVVFGLLALAVFLGWFGMPRSAPLVGGLTLALMTLPTIIIATRAAVGAVPPSIREAALALGASRHQVVLHHVLPLAMPGILTGTIIGLAQALGETAPLLLIGMNAYIGAGVPAGPLDAATALPTQIFIWSDSPERGFASRTSAAIMVLLAFLIAMNAAAIFLRRRFERRW